MKKSIAFLAFAAISMSAYAADERDASRLVKKYSETVAVHTDAALERWAASEHIADFSRRIE